MALSFGRLMKEADRNYKDVSSKISQIEMKNKTNTSHGPNADAVRAFLEKKKATEKQNQASKKLEDKQRLLENKAKEAKIKKTTQTTEFLKKMLQHPPGITPTNDDTGDKAPQRLREERKSEQALKAAKDKLKSRPTAFDTGEKKFIMASSNDKLLSRHSNGNAKSITGQAASRSTKSVKKSQPAPPAKQKPVDFMQLMQVASKNRDEKVHYDDLIAAKRRTEENLTDLKLKTKSTALYDKPKKETLLSSNNNSTIKSKSATTIGSNNTAKVKLKVSSKKETLDAISKTKKRPPTAPAAISQNSAKTKSTANCVNDNRVKKPLCGPAVMNNKSKEKLNIKNRPETTNTLNSKNISSYSTQKIKPVPDLVLNGTKKKLVLSASTIKGAAIKKMPALTIKPPVFGRTVPTSNKIVKRPGTPPSNIVLPIKKPKIIAPPNLPSTSGQTFAKKSDLQRALMQRREMLFKNPQQCKRQMNDDDDDDVDDYDSDMDDFIDDTEYGQELEYSQEIRKLFKYDPKKYKYLNDDDDRRMESTYNDIQKEEARSARLGLLEDLQDIQREQDEMKKQLKKIR